MTALRSVLTMVTLFLLLWCTASSHAHAHSPKRDVELEQKISKLQRATEKKPTTIHNVAKRLETFWQWANAYALAGLPIDPDVPATVARIRDPGPASQISPLDLNDIDRWVREFTYREAQPTAIGSLSSPKLSGFEVDQFHQLTIQYTVGSRALESGDGFVLGELTYGKGPLLQARDPQGDNFVAITSSNPDVTFDVESYPIRGMFSGTMARSVVMTGPARKVFFRLKQGSLAPGAKVTITLGEQSFGSRGLGLIAPSVDALRFRLWLHLDAEALLMTLPELQFRSVGGPAIAVRGFGPSIVAIDEPFAVTVRFEDKFRNLAEGKSPSAWLMNGEQVLGKVDPDTEGVQKITGLSFDKTGVYRLSIRAEGFVAPGEVNPILVQQSPQQRLYWGETHGHSGFSEGMGSVNGVYEFARDQARLDFMALTEHDYWMDDAEWETLREAAQKYNEPGQFLAFLAYEWTVHSKNGGHHNIIFRTPEDRNRVSRQQVQTLDGLYKALNQSSKKEDLLLIPHAHNPGDWGQSDPHTQRFVEIVSLHGTFEWFGQRYLDQGFMVGFLGGSDDHMGHPGLRPLRRNPTSDNFGGLLGLYAAEKTNNAVFDAMRNIQGYATNGVRSILELQLNGNQMGTQVSSAKAAHFVGAIHATAPIEEISVLKNGAPIFVQDYRATEDVQAEFIEIRFWSDSYPREKGALARQWRRWRGSVEVSGADIEELTAPQNDNPYTEFANRRVDSNQQLDFFLKTRGSYKSILLKLRNRQPGATIRLSGIKESPLPQEAMQTLDFEISLDQVSKQSLQLDVPVENYDDHILVRTVQPALKKDIEINFEHPQAAVPGDYYYLRARQTDGGLIWSSPFKVQ